MQLLIRDNRTFELESPSTSVILHIVVALSYLATFLDTNSLSGLMCRKAVNQSINLVCLFVGYCVVCYNVILLSV